MEQKFNVNKIVLFEEETPLARKRKIEWIQEWMDIDS
jgi:hypothetical protein